VKKALPYLYGYVEPEVPTVAGKVVEGSDVKKDECGDEKKNEGDYVCIYIYMYIYKYIYINI
jgi:hypothetical protein